MASQHWDIKYVGKGPSNSRWESDPKKIAKTYLVWICLNQISKGIWWIRPKTEKDRYLWIADIDLHRPSKWWGTALNSGRSFWSSYRRKFRSQTSDNMERWKAVSREKSQKRKDQKKEDAGARKGRKVAKHCVFSWFCGSGGLKSRLAKAAGAETTSGEMRDEKLHAVVARSRFRSEKVQNTSASDHFWKLRCWKSARRCGAKQIWK